MTEQRKANAYEKERNQRAVRSNAALKAKLAFIEEKYDYSSSAKNMSIQDFKELIESNLGVNQSITTFSGKLSNIQKEIQTIETMKSMMI